MAIIPKPIVLVQHLPATGDYIVFREGDIVETHRAGTYDGSEDFHRYVRDCVSSGAYKEVNFSVPTGLVSGPKSITCKQIVYCKPLDKQYTSAMQKTADVVSQTKTAVNMFFAKANEIAHVRWNPYTYELYVQNGKVPIPSTYHIHSLEEAPVEVQEYIRKCVEEDAVCLKRSYNRPLTINGVSRMTLVSEYCFSTFKAHKDFKGRDTEPISEEDKKILGLV